MASKEFKWLHLTDLHVGQHSMKWLWPNLKSVFIADLERIYKNTGGFDALIFSGDLTQKGCVAEYDTLTSLLQELYENLDKWGGIPLFFPVPGNHDLVRPDMGDPESLLLKRWWEEPTVSAKFWQDSTNRYRQQVEKTFENYTNWLNELPSKGIKTPVMAAGILPGDRSAKIQLDDLSVGIVGLNSTFLQIDGGDFEGKLALDVRQLLAVTGDNPSAWCAENDINFLVTHHPPAWLEPQARQIFLQEISPPSRFTAHLYGHMHEAGSTTLSISGGPYRKSIQGPSIFGLEFLKDETSKRLHGYSAGVISIDGDSAYWRLWPRKDHVRTDGARRFIPDYEFALEYGEEYTKEQLTLVRKDTATTPVSKITSTDVVVSSIKDTPGNEAVLSRAKYHIPESDQNVFVRLAAQQACTAAIAIDRIVWICTDWGLGTDGFIYSVAKQLNRQNQPFYQIDLGNYEDREDFLAKFPETHGCPFPDFCRFLVNSEAGFLIFNNASSETEKIVADVENLGGMVLDFCPQISVLVITRMPPTAGKLSHVELVPLDEADTRSYIFKHGSTTDEVKNARDIAEIFRLTDGIPDKIERLIRRLRVVNLHDISISYGTENVENSKSREEIPRALTKAVKTIIDSTDDGTQRTALMLKLLCILPYGETLNKIKRFDSKKVFYIHHAEELLDLGLIDVRNSMGVMSANTKNNQIKILVARGPVRDYVRSLLSEREMEALTKRAMELYFEQHRGTGVWRIRSRDGVNISDDMTTLNNGHELALRSLAKVVSSGHKDKMKASLALAQVYCGELHSGRHYRNCAAACDSVVSATHSEENFLKNEVMSIKYLLAKSIRMLGEHERARLLLEELRSHIWPKDFNESILLNYALCLQSLKDNDAIKVAKELIDLSPKSSSAIQAKSIIVEMSNSENSDSELLKLENDAKKRGAVTVRNNLILARAKVESNNPEILDVLKEVRDSSLKLNDSYTAGRASVKIATIMSRRQEGLTNEALNYLVQSYQYFYGQRFHNLFVDAHKALWEVFEKSGDVPNLLSLFKYSSFIWRLSGNDEREKTYIEKLTRSAVNVLSTDLRTADQDTAYFVARAKSRPALK